MSIATYHHHQNLKRFTRNNTPTIALRQVARKEYVPCGAGVGWTTLSGSMLFVHCTIGGGVTTPAWHSIDMDGLATLDGNGGSTITGYGNWQNMTYNIQAGTSGGIPGQVRTVGGSVKVTFTGSTFNNQGTAFFGSFPPPEPTSNTREDYAAALVSGAGTYIYPVSQLREGVVFNFRESSAQEADEFYTAGSASDPHVTGVNNGFLPIYIAMSGMDTTARIFVEIVRHVEIIPEASHSSLATPPHKAKLAIASLAPVSAWDKVSQLAKRTLSKTNKSLDSVGDKIGLDKTMLGFKLDGLENRAIGTIVSRMVGAGLRSRAAASRPRQAAVRGRQQLALRAPPRRGRVPRGRAQF